MRTRLLFILSSLVLLSVACGGDDDEEIPEGHCGPGPYATFSAELTSTLDMSPVSGAAVTLDLCSDREFTSDASGVVSWEMTTDVEFAGTIRADGFIPTMTTNEMIQAELATDGPLTPEALIPTLPHWSESSPTVLVVGVVIPPALPEGSPPECLTPAGMTVSIAGHPDAVVTYYKLGVMGPEPDAALTQMSDAGLAEVSGLDATGEDESVTVEMDKPGCDLATLRSYPHLDRIQLADGILTGVPVFIPGTPWPEGEPQ